MVPRRAHPLFSDAISRLLLVLCSFLLASQSARAGNRLTFNFNPDWKFLKADSAGASETGFDDSQWQTVSAPHTYNDTDTFDDWSAPNHVGETNLWAGRAWYRKSFTMPEDYRTKRVYIEFEAVRQIAEVYLNGQPIGTNRTGFIPFGFDLTPFLRFGNATNVLAVMADNRFTMETDMAKIALTDLPWNSPHWHPPHGGIYRNVYLHVTDPLHINLPLYSSLKTTGPYLYESDFSERSVVVNGEIPIQNERNSEQAIEARVELFDVRGKSVLKMTESNALAAGAQTTIKLKGLLENPQLWEPSYPYLYKATCSVAVNGEIVDSVEIPVGIRSVHFDPKAGFSINGHHTRLHGWGQKPTSEWPGLGAAQPDWMHYYTLGLMKEAGGNFVRWGHCAGAPADIASADQLGLLVLQPGVDGEGDARGTAWTLRAAAFRDMLIYYRNHPSIVIWEGGNQKVTREHASELREHMNTFDPHGGRAYAHRRADEATAEFMAVDIGTEGGRQIPRLPVVEGEYDREESPRRVWDNFSPPNFGYPEAKGQTYQLTSEQYAVNEVAEYVHKLGQPYHCGGANWIFSDSTSGGRVACEVARCSGEVDGVRLPKEAYYVCRAMFRSDPQIHIIGHWNYAGGTRKAVYVVSNCPEVELFLNGRSLGHGKRSDTFLFTFLDVGWKPGEIKAVGSRKGEPLCTDVRHTVGPAVALKLTPISGPAGFQADGSDVTLVDVEAVDAKGERCPTVQQRVDFQFSGPAVWRGGYCSGQTNSINKTFLDLECGINRIALRATRGAGAILLKAESSKLEPASLTLNSVPVEIKNGASSQRPPMSAQIEPVPRRAHEQLLVSLSEPAIQNGRCLRAFSYSGPTTMVCVQEGAKEGSKIYVDRNATFQNLPTLLIGCDWVQTANADKLYSAADLIDLAPNADATVYIAHDDRLPRPAWLQRQFTSTQATVTIEGKPMQVFQCQVRSGEALTLGSNVEDRKYKSCNMYVVFLKVAGGESPKPAGGA